MAAELDPETKARLEGYRSLTDEEFNALPKSDQVQWWLWKSQGIEEFASEWYDFTKKPQDKYPTTVSENSAPAEITARQTYQLRFILSLEPAERGKALVSVLGQGLNSPNYAYWTEFMSQFVSAVPNAKVLAINDVLPVATDEAFVGDLVSAERGLVKTIRNNETGTEGMVVFDTTTVNPFTNTITPDWYSAQ